MRSWGGKIIVGLLGMLVGGPIGLIVGVLVDHFLDRGVPEEMIRMATEKTAEISKAYEMIKESRGFR